MLSLCFEEYLIAKGDDSAIQALKTVPMPSYAHGRLLNLPYFLCGQLDAYLDWAEPIPLY